MSQVQTRLFKSNQSQAVRLPKAVALPESVQEITIIRQGKGRLIVPIENAWDDWFNAAGVSDDFMSERTQEADQHRVAL
jgi:antitoxin VapB